MRLSFKKEFCLDLERLLKEELIAEEISTFKEKKETAYVAIFKLHKHMDNIMYS